MGVEVLTAKTPQAIEGVERILCTGVSYFLQNAMFNTILTLKDVPNDPDRTPLEATPFTLEPRQQWVFEHVAQSRYRIRSNFGHRKLVTNLVMPNNPEGSPICILHENNQANQVWIAEATEMSAGYRFKNMYTGKYLTAVPQEGRQSKTQPVQGYSFNESSNQAWVLFYSAIKETG